MANMIGTQNDEDGVAYAIYQYAFRASGCNMKDQNILGNILIWVV